MDRPCPDQPIEPERMRRSSHSPSHKP
jgi:hypothetical protein